MGRLSAALDAGSVGLKRSPEGFVAPPRVPTRDLTHPYPRGSRFNLASGVGSRFERALFLDHVSSVILDHRSNAIQALDRVSSVI